MLLPLADVPRWYAERKPADAIAISHGADALTWHELERRANARARAFAAKGVKPGDFVAIGLPNSNAFFETSFAVWKCGATPTSLSWRLPRGEAAAVLDILKPSLVVGGEADWNAPNSLPVNFVPEGFSEEPFDAPVARYWKAMTSGGSTGRPKVILDHNPAVIETTAEATLGIARDTSLLNPGPLYHNAPFILSHFALFGGGQLTGMIKFDAEETLRLIERARVQWVNFVPTMMHRIWALPEEVRNRYDVSSLRWAIGGGEKTPEARIRAFSDHFRNARYIDAYGLTESCGGDTFMDAGREIEKIGSTGRAIAHVEIEIRDDAGKRLPAGRNGEICLRGPKVTRGYWKDPEKTASAFFGDWFRTGDIGYLDEDGFLYLTDRKKDMIVSGGENIASSEVERVIYEIPGVREVAVIGLPDDRWGEKPVAIVVLADDAKLDLSDLTDFCRARLAAFKVPRQLIIRDSLPRNPSGKVLKRVLRAELEATT